MSPEGERKENFRHQRGKNVEGRRIRCPWFGRQMLRDVRVGVDYLLKSGSCR